METTSRAIPWVSWRNISPICTVLLRPRTAPEAEKASVSARWFPPSLSRGKGPATARSPLWAISTGRITGFRATSSWSSRARSISIGRLSGMSGADTPNSYVLRVADSGSWSILKTSTKQPEALLASGNVNPLGVGAWHAVSLEFHGASITASIDGAPAGGFRFQLFPGHGRFGSGCLRPGAVRQLQGGFRANGALELPGPVSVRSLSGWQLPRIRRSGTLRNIDSFYGM